MKINYSIVIASLFFITSNAYAHHVLGRPSYALGEDSNTPPSMQVETQIGDYYVTYMAFPAFPKPGDYGRVNLYIKRIDSGATFNGIVDFKITDDSFVSSNQELLGRQKIDDGVYRQGFIIKEQGQFLITAEFESTGKPYILDFPLQIGEPAFIGPVGISVFVVTLIIILVNLTGAKKMFRIKAWQHRIDQNTMQKTVDE